jgi:23S rRNA (uracil1939-C5)-methyltransferase
MEPRVAVTVRGIAAGGAGVADLPDGRVVFVPRTAPGDRASIRIRKSRPRWAEGSLCEIIEPSVERRDALCALYARCGGCQLQHLPYARQLEWKGRVVADALQRIGRLEGVDVPQVVGSPLETGYRSRVTYTLRHLEGWRVAAGFHALERPAHVLDVVDECVLPHEALTDAWKALRAGWGQGALLLPAGGRLRLTLRAAGDGVSLVVEGGPSGWRAEALAAAVPALDAIWHLPRDSSDEPRLVAGDASEAPVFEQVNPEAAALLVEHVLAQAGHASGSVERAVDAYCGDGVYARGLADRGWRVTGIERSRSACAAARGHAGRFPAGVLTVLEGAVEDRLGEALPAELVVVNPPRAGLDAGVVRALGDSHVSRVVYVSCDPATLARDVAGLSTVYQVASIRCFDLFPQTAHVETVVALSARDT